MSKKNPNIAATVVVQKCIQTRLSFFGGLDFLETMVRNELSYHTGVPVNRLSKKYLDVAFKEILGVTLSSLQKAKKKFDNCMVDEGEPCGK